MILIKWKISNKWTLIDSSRVNEVIRKISSLFILKDFERTKTQIKPKPIKKLSEQKSTKARIFRAQKFLKGKKLVILCFLKKKKIVLITLVFDSAVIEFLLLIY